MSELSSIGPYVPTDYDRRNAALRYAVEAGAKPADVVKTATDILAFLTSGNVSAATQKPDAKTEKPAKASAPATETPATEQSSDKPAASTADASKATSPSEPAAGFAEDGSEITVADIRAAAVKFVTAHDEKALFAVLGQFSVEKLSALQPTDYAAFMQALVVPVASEGVFD